MEIYGFMDVDGDGLPDGKLLLFLEEPIKQFHEARDVLTV